MSDYDESDSYWDDRSSEGDDDDTDNRSESVPYARDVSARDVVYANTFDEDLCETGDVQKDMENIWTSRTLSWESTFLFRKTYTDAPDAALTVEGLGAVSLPFFDRDAEAIKPCALQVSSEEPGSGECVVWEIDASKVTLANSKWEDYVDSVVDDVCDALSFTCNTAELQWELQKLSVYEAGSHLLQPTSSEQGNPNLAATLIIFLPSQHAGGAVHFASDGLSVEHDCSEITPDRTNVLAWLPDALHNITLITSSYCLALSYRLFTSEPTRPSQRLALPRVARVLETWNASTGPSEDTPTKLVCLLARKYAPAGLALGALSGADAAKARVLAALARTHGLALGLVGVHCSARGATDRDYEDDEVWPELAFTRLVDAHSGRALAPGLDVDEGEQVPWYLDEELRQGCWEREEWEDEGEYATWERWWTGTALVVWRQRDHLCVLYSGKDGFQRACAALEGTTDTGPTAADDALIDALLARTDGDAKCAAAACCQAACTWKSAQTWCRVAEACAESLGLAVVPHKRKFEAAQLFGFGAVRAAFERMLDAEQRNAVRLMFLKSMEQWLEKSPPDTTESKEEMQSWIEVQTQVVLGSLQTPRLQAETTILLDAAKVNGGLAFLTERILPQLKACTGSTWFFVPLAEALHRDTAFDDATKSKVVRSMLSTKISKARFFASAASAKTGADDELLPKGPPADYFAHSKRLADACVNLGHPSLVDFMVKRILAWTANPKRVASELQECAQKLLVPFVSYLAERAQGSPGHQRPKRFGELQRSAVRLWLEWFKDAPGRVPQEETKKMMDAATLHDGSPDVLVEVFVPTVEALDLTPSRLCSLVEVFRTPDPLVYPPGYTGPTFGQIGGFLATRYTQEVALDDMGSIACAVAWTVDVMPALAPSLFARILDTAKLAPGYVKAALMPLPRQLSSMLRAQPHAAALAPLFRGIAAAWADTMPPRADAAFTRAWHTLRTWTCACTHCAAARAFLTRGPGAATELRRIGAATRRHVEQELARHAPRLASWATLGTSPQGLSIRKADALCRYTAWTYEQNGARQMLRDMSADEAELQRILGDEHARILKAMAEGAHIGEGPASSPVSSTGKRGILGISPLVHKSKRRKTGEGSR
ncbi:hypothetical protein PsYK624_034440 [Phanerochaete sordida]|uniref:Uncharacterized protein n=1 Tax=Phanerochaete sordida TaxID=48140 RepID=A0A9P3G350_9APHY|nr:hypothetical protein PsYK624_034440 [Phanerochaete sordida]